MLVASEKLSDSSSGVRMDGHGGAHWTRRLHAEPRGSAAAGRMGTCGLPGRLWLRGAGGGLNDDWMEVSVQCLMCEARVVVGDRQPTNTSLILLMVKIPLCPDIKPI